MNNQYQQPPSGYPQQWPAPPAGQPTSPQYTPAMQPQGFQQQWQTQDAAPRNNAAMQPQRPPMMQHSFSAPQVIQQSGPLMAPSQMRYAPGGVSQQMATTTTTTTTTTSSHRSHAGTQHFPQRSVPPLVDQFQNLQIQQQAAPQPVYSPPPPVYAQPPPTAGQMSPVQPPAPPPSAPPVLQAPPPQPARQRAPTVPMVQSKYSITVEQRQYAYQLWLQQNPGKPQKTQQRMMNDYLSGSLDKQISETLTRQQTIQQTQSSIQTQQMQTQQAAEQKQADKQLARQQRTQEREQKKAQDEQREREYAQRQQAQLQQQMMPRGMPGGLGGSSRAPPGGGQRGLENFQGFNTTTTTTTTETRSTMLLQDGASGAGEQRRQALAGGTTTIQQFDQQIQTLLIGRDICPQGYEWLPLPDGYMCCGASHFISDKEIDAMIADSQHKPKVEIVNFPIFNGPMGNDGFATGWYPSKKPPRQLSRLSPPWEWYGQVRYCMDMHLLGFPAVWAANLFGMMMHPDDYNPF